MDRKVLNEINDLSSPLVIERFTGQERVKRRIKIALEAAWNDGTKLPHMLFTGSPGLGKSQLAYICAKEMGSDLYQQLAQNISCPTDLHAFLLEPKDREVALLDEIHELPEMAQVTLYRAMENQEIFLGSRRDKKSRPLKISNFTVIGCTTDPHRLLKPLRDRFRLVLSFEYYSNQELEIILRYRCKLLNWQVEEKVFSMIASKGRGVPRIALRILESCRRTARSENSAVITVQHFKRTCQIEGLDKYGLGTDERKYLSILAEHHSPIRLNIIATRLGLHQRTVRDVIEPYLIRIGLMIKDDKGRFLTAKGLEHIRSNSMQYS